MKYRKLGSTDLEVSEIGMGAWAIGGPFDYGDRPIGWGRVDDAESIQTIRKAVEMGVNLIDTADIYGFGHSEEVIRRALEGVQGPVYIASKVGFLKEGSIGKNQDFSGAYIERACEESLRRLGRETIDLYQLHCVPHDVIRKGEVFRHLDRLKAKGKIRYYGVSIVTDEEAIASMSYPGISSIQIIFNMLRQKPSRTVFPLALEKGIGILARVPLASGLLCGKFAPETRFDPQDHRSQPIPGETFSGVDLRQGLDIVGELGFLKQEGTRTLTQAALRWILDFEATSTVIPGARRPGQVTENVCASDIPNLSDDEHDRIRKIYSSHVAPSVERVY